MTDWGRLAPASMSAMVAPASRHLQEGRMYSNFDLDAKCAASNIAGPFPLGIFTPRHGPTKLTPSSPPSPTLLRSPPSESVARETIIFQGQTPCGSNASSATVLLVRPVIFTAGWNSDATFDRSLVNAAGPAFPSTMGGAANHAGKGIHVGNLNGCFAVPRLTLSAGAQG